jgi:hypothetical protein
MEMNWQQVHSRMHELAAGSYLEFMAWQQVHTRKAWTGSSFILGKNGLATGSYLKYMGRPQVIPGPHGMATGSYLEYMGWPQEHVLAEFHT